MSYPGDGRRRARTRVAPRMAEVARLAGVSNQTVSRVVNGHPNVSAETRERVERAIKQLGYRRNAAARALATHRTMNLGVVSVGLAQWGPSVTLFGIAEAAREAGYGTSVVSLGEDTNLASMRAAYDHLVESGVDGIIVMAPVEAAAVSAEALPSDEPLVFFEPGADNGTTIVAVDEILGARLATRHLLEAGHESVWHVSGPAGWLATEARIRGWREELSAAGSVAHEVVEGDWSARGGYAAGQLIAQHSDATAVFVANDQMALGLLGALRDKGLAVPNDVSVVGFDDVPESGYFSPALTTVRLDFEEVGHRCVERLLGLIRGEELEVVPPVQPELVVRHSTVSRARGDSAALVPSHDSGHR